MKALDKKKAADAKARQPSEAYQDSRKNSAPIAGVNVQKPISGDRDRSRAEIEVPKQLPSGKPIQGKAPGDNRPTEEKMEIEKSIAGRKTMKGTDGKKPRPEKVAPSSANTDQDGAAKTTSSAKAGKTETEEEHEVELEINSILKKGPSKFT